jgi:hypothetical protein
MCSSPRIRAQVESCRARRPMSAAAFSSIFARTNGSATFIIAAAGRTMAAIQRPLSEEILTFELEAAGGELIVRLSEQTGRFSSVIPSAVEGSPVGHPMARIRRSLHSLRSVGMTRRFFRTARLGMRELFDWTRAHNRTLISRDTISIPDLSCAQRAKSGARFRAPLQVARSFVATRSSRASRQSRSAPTR